ncbi:hypothetical protein PPERSA_08947 [Pseudocohnilembus persalinus]|uniref:START domain-containing protein n=1 Tax=Pseudocohnilembus persalinus TaxID=266149 RepID=A0A0V0R301_PSEPJ|nr:hypothetical protein PPERSA_08947 [Pseudocohnilembus persalinus]|eukprot:KRX08843.1 hypothetical protein PPERSA_08947 [Pseudocohnilembus persalinus]
MEDKDNRNENQVQQFKQKFKEDEQMMEELKNQLTQDQHLSNSEKQLYQKELSNEINEIEQNINYMQLGAKKSGNDLKLQQQIELNLQSQQIVQEEQQKISQNKKLSPQQQYEQQILEMSDLIKDQKYDQAYQILENLKKNDMKSFNYYLEQVKQNLKNQNASDIQKQVDKVIIKTVDEVLYVQSQIQFMNYVQNDDQGWGQEQAFTNGQTKINYKILPNTKTLSIKFEAEFERPLSRPSDSQKVVYVKFKLPVISDREGYLYGIGVDRLEKDDSIVIFIESIQDKKDIQQRLDLNLEINKKNVAFDMKFMYFQIKPIGRDKSVLNAICNVDPNVRFLPQWLINFFIRKIGSYLMNKILKIAENIKGKMELNTQYNKIIFKTYKILNL